MTAKDAKVNFSLRKSVANAKVNIKTRLPRWDKRKMLPYPHALRDQGLRQDATQSLRSA